MPPLFCVVAAGVERSEILCALTISSNDIVGMTLRGAGAIVAAASSRLVMPAAPSAAPESTLCNCCINWSNGSCAFLAALRRSSSRLRAASASANALSLASISFLTCSNFFSRSWRLRSSSDIAARASSSFLRFIICASRSRRRRNFSSFDWPPVGDVLPKGVLRSAASAAAANTFVLRGLAAAAFLPRENPPNAGRVSLGLAILNPPKENPILAGAALDLDPSLRELPMLDDRLRDLSCCPWEWEDERFRFLS
mmetsp:Transcript_28318/g.41878  ORF Transcript_28318/g.41878 Transcript_28318/m.41878 type:complete len:254 (+) Transcript_28318:578-1339(+)